MKIPFVFVDYLNGKTIYPIVRRFLNLLFCLSITSFLFEKIYFHYYLPDITDYKTIINFFLKGYFIIPFCLFLLVYGTTHYIPMFLFSYFTYYQSVKLIRRIVEYEVNKDIERGIGSIRALSRKFSPVELNKETVINLYLEYKDSLAPETLDEFENDCDKLKSEVQGNFIFAFRAIVTISIFFVVLPLLGWILFSITIVALLFYMFLLFVQYHFFNILPMVVRKLKYEAEKYIQAHFQKLNQLQKD